MRNIDRDHLPFNKSQQLVLDTILAMIGNQHCDIEDISMVLLRVAIGIIFRDIPDSVDYNAQEVLRVKDKAADVLFEIYKRIKHKFPNLKTQLVGLSINRIYHKSAQMNLVPQT